MGKSGAELCLFKQVDELKERATAMEDFVLPPDSDMLRVASYPHERACRVGSCAITGSQMISYAGFAGEEAGRGPDQTVPPLCPAPSE